MEQMRYDHDMALFLTVVDKGGFSAAARAVGQTHSAISKRVRQLEDRLGAQLLVRTTRTMRLTGAGERYVYEAREIMERITALESEISDGTSQLKGKIRLTTSNAFGKMHIVPAVIYFMQLHPEIEVDLTLTDAVVDIVQDDFDMAVRNATLPDSSLIGRKLMTNRRVVCASPEYLARQGVPNTPEDLARHACLRLNLSSVFNEWGLKVHSEQRLRLGPGFACNSLEALHVACVAGLGIAWLPMFLIGPDLETERLTPVLDAYRDVSTDSAISIVRPAGHFVPARVRALTEFFVERFRASIL
jgi:DNA-binding transcriptional LysR family regulator